MSALFPFRALRPAPDVAARVASVPYDVVSTDEARALVKGHPLSFLRVTRSEVDLPPETNPYDARVYAQALRNFEDLKRSAPFVLDDEPSLYFYRLRMGAHEQTGLAGCFSLDEYDRDLVKKHEWTFKDKEDDRTRHITELRAQTGVVFLTYRASAAIDRIATRVTAGRPLYDFVASDGISHTIWRLSASGRREDSGSSRAGATARGGGAPRAIEIDDGGTDVQALVEAFAELPALYIADGHHRAASAARARTALGQAGGRSVDASRFLAVAFPDTQVQVLSYNRVVRDLAGLTPEALLAALRAKMRVADDGAAPTRPGDVGMFLADRWYGLTLPTPGPGGPPAGALDVAVLDQEVLEPLLEIGDIRTDKRIDFVGGARGTVELERRVRSGQAVSVSDLIAIADAGGVMPPKSTWFEPKLRDGLLVHLI